MDDKIKHVLKPLFAVIIIIGAVVAYKFSAFGPERNLIDCVVISSLIAFTIYWLLID